MMMLNQIISEHGLNRLNTATKYPSILTYHAMGDKGALQRDLTAGSDFGGSAVVITEKVDGTNTRIIFDENGDFILGSREELLYAKGDRVWSEKQPILHELLNTKLPHIVSDLPGTGITVLFGEVYGEKVNSGYTKSRGFLLFDAMRLDVRVLALPSSELSLWRENGGQSFLPFDELDAFAAMAAKVPALHAASKSVEPPPLTLEDTYEYLRKWLPTSHIPETAKPEGIVVRTPDRRIIRKLRYQDYERTFLRMKSR